MESGELPVVYVYPSAWTGPLRPHPRAWHLMSDEPGEAILRFAEKKGAVVVRVVSEGTLI